MASPARDFAVVDVLTRSGEARDAFCALLDDGPDIDAQLVSDVLRTTGRVGVTLQTRRSLVELCALVRAIDAAERGRIELPELRAGIEIHAARTDRFVDFHYARVILRTLVEVLDGGRAEHADARALRAQVTFLHHDLRVWLLEQLTGDATGGLATAAVSMEPESADDQRARWRTRQPAARVAADALVTELLEGARHHPVTGLLGAAWIRDWSAVPMAGELLGEDPAELTRFATALQLLDPRPAALVQVNRRRPERWQLRGDTVTVGDQLRDSWTLPPTLEGLHAAATERDGWTIITAPKLEFAYVEGDGYHAVLGPRDFVERLCGCSVLEGVAAFREHVEALAVEDEPPPDLLEVATRFGRLRRRSR